MSLIPPIIACKNLLLERSNLTAIPRSGFGMDWKKLIKLCSQGDATAFAEFVKKYYGLLHYLVARRIPNDAEHEDIIQEVLLKFHRLNLFEKFKGETEEEFRGYVARICLNTLFTSLKSQKTENDALVYVAPEDLENIGIADPANTQLNSVIDAEIMARLTKEIAMLPEAYRDIINLRLLGNSNQEIAGILRKPKGTIDSYNARAIEILRQKLKEFASS